MVDQAGYVGRSLLGRYRLETVIANGGMGTVWTAEDSFLGRKVAVKILTWESDSDRAGAAADRVRREARAAASLRHPNIACVYDYGQQDGIAFLVMELLEGESLAARLHRHGALPPEQAAHVATEVAEALDAAHRAGIVHRDVKPGNIMLETSGAVKLLDFGIAAISGQRTYPGQERLLGTAAYLSPEWGDDGPADPAGDVYSLGVVVYEMLAGRPPFTGNSLAAVAAAHAANPPPPLTLLNPDVPPAMAAVCERALSKDPAARPPSAGAFAAQLSAGLPDASPPMREPRAVRPIGPVPAGAGAAAGTPVAVARLGSATQPVWSAPGSPAGPTGDPAAGSRRRHRETVPRRPRRRWRSLAVALMAVVALAFALQGSGVLQSLLAARGGGSLLSGTPVTAPPGDGVQTAPPPTVTTVRGNRSGGGGSSGSGPGDSSARDSRPGFRPGDGGGSNGGGHGGGNGGDQHDRDGDHSGHGHGGDG
jgi:eukaryotic-like serine/threonine-protein kinase